MRSRIVRLYRKLVWAAKDIERLEAALDGLGPIVRAFKPTLFEVRAREVIHGEAVALRESVSMALDTAIADHADLEARLSRALRRHGPVEIRGMRLSGEIGPGGPTLRIEEAAPRTMEARP
jgi:hypothetical protein